MTTSDDIAIVGRSCRLPGASKTSDLWALLSSGRCAVTQIPADRWLLERYRHPRPGERGRSYTFAAGTLADIWGFDAAAFGLSPREAEQMDPQQRLLLELTWEAFENSGIRPSKLAGSETGVFVGASSLDYGNLRINDVGSGDAYMMTGNTLSIISNRISYIFDLHGPSLTVDTACSSALVALNEAVACLRSGRIDTAIAGGVNIIASPFNYVGFSQAAMLSRTGLCQAFSAQADGYVRAEGGVVLVLRTREAAERDGDPILGFIVGSGVNSDGRTNGISLPSKTYQARLLERLYAGHGVDPNDLAFIEAHGTGTRAGDPVEAGAIGETLGQKRRDPLLIGSIKTNIGHMEAASGLGGVLKAMLALEHSQLPASLHCQDLNPDIDFETLNLKVSRELTPIARPDGRRRLAGVNSFGFGGTNAHVILAEAPRQAAGKERAAQSDPRYLFISAHTRGALDDLVAEYASRFGEPGSEAGTAAIAAAAAYRREHLPHRIAIPMRPRSELASILGQLCGDEGATAVGAVRGQAIDRDALVAFVFSGNGGQFAGMGRQAYERNADFRDHIGLVSNEFEALAGWRIEDMLHASDLADQLHKTRISQPLLYAIQAAASHAMRRHGLEPAFVLGHSVGEIAAAEAAGILDRAAALRTIHARSLHQEATAGLGSMAVIIGSREAAAQILAALPGLTIAAYNSSRAFTVAGTTADIDQLPALARHHRVRIRKLDLDYPFHSSLMAPVERPLLRSLARLTPGRARVPFISTVTGTRLEGPELDAAYWWRNIREPVQFTDAIGLAVQRGARIFVEIGPAASLISHINDISDERAAPVAAFSVFEKRDAGGDPVAMAVAQALARGAKLDEAMAFGPVPDLASAPGLPGYPWQRKTYRLAETAESPGMTRSGPWHPLTGARFSPELFDWHSVLDTSLHPALADHRIDGRAILPGAAFAEMALAVARDWLGTSEASVADLEISSPMILTPETSRDVICRVSPQIAQIEIMSRPRYGQTPWQIHATGKIIRDPLPALVPGAGERLSSPGSRVITGPQIYAMAARAGLNYGPAFQKLATAVAVRPDRIHLELTRDAADPAYGADPARMDSCFHALVLIFTSLRDDGQGTAYIPVRFGEISLHRAGTAFTTARIDVLRRDERSIIANFYLMAEDGELVATLREARFQAIRISRGQDSFRQMIVMNPVLASEPAAGRNGRPLSLAALRDAVAPMIRPHGTIAPDFVLLDGWATSVALHLARDMSTAGFIDTQALVSAGRLPAKVKPWFEDVLTALDHSGLASKDKLGRHIETGTGLPPPDTILRTIAEEHQNLSAELLVAASAEAAIKSLTSGDLETFERRLPSKAIDGWELGGSQSRAAAATIAGLLQQSLFAWPKDRAMRILQIGFGALTGRAAALASQTESRLTVLDPGPRRLERAQMTYAAQGDISFIGEVSGLSSAGYDLVIAAHALYRYKQDASFWANLARAMAPGAVFLALEPPPSFFRDLILGLDARLATGSAAAAYDGLSVPEEDWLELLRGAGLDDAEVVTVATDDGASRMLSAQAPVQRRHLSGSGSALIIGDGDAYGTQTTSAFATLLASSGLHVSIVLDSELLDEHVANEPETVVFFANACDQHVSPVKGLLDQCLRLKHLAGRIGNRQTAFWLVTAGAVAGSESLAVSDCASGLWTFSRVIANEFPALDMRRVDITASLSPGLLAERLRDLVFSKTNETEILLGANVTRAVRFDVTAPQDRGQGRPAEAGRLVRREGAGLDRIQWEAIQRVAPGVADVEIAVEATGLNFRDVMFGLGLLPEDILEHGFAGAALGLECAGRIERTGASVKSLQRGDRVIAFAKHAFSTHVTTPASVVAKIPDDMPIAAAATIPVAFLTAYYGLILCARLKPGEWVLIHGGAGGVGLAALQIARWRGARVIATAGSPEKRALLASLGAEEVFDSRSGAFAGEVRRVTGEGVAVVLNSLSGEPMERSIGLLRPFGRFVELGKRDYVTNSHIGLRPFRRNLTYFGVDLDQVLAGQPATAKLLMRSVLRLFAKGVLTALPYRIFEASGTAEAFRLMQNAGHIGKLIVKPPRETELVARQRRTFQVSASKIHLITGGFGGFGLETARFLVEKGARHLMLIGRSGAASPEARAALAEFADQGVRVRVEALDVADKAAMQRLFKRFGRDLPPLGGVIHAAMVLDDALSTNLTAEQFVRVLRPKVAGAHHLDMMTRDLVLDYFILFSSVSALIGNPGQAAYVAANGYLEGLARRRRGEGLPALAIGWGAIGDAGVLARNDGLRETLASRTGTKTLLAREALRLMGEALSAPAFPGDAVVTIAPMNWAAARQHLAVVRSPSFAKLTSQGDTGPGEQKRIDVAALVAQNTPAEARKIIGALVVEGIARVLRLSREDVPVATPLAEIGLDSLMAVELALGLEERFELKAPLPATASTLTVNELADHVIGLATGSMSGDEAMERNLFERHLGMGTADAETLGAAVDEIRKKSRETKGILH